MFGKVHQMPRSPYGVSNVTRRKISLDVAQIVTGQASELRLRNLEAKLDWGGARDYVEGIWPKLQDKADDYGIATGETYSQPFRN